MSVARIVTPVKQDADELASDLRSRGFEVEIVSPGDIPGYAADLEITLEECSTEQALRSVENLPQQEEVCVFIAPGALVESARPMIVVPLFPEEEQAVVRPAVWPMNPVPALFQVEESELPSLAMATSNGEAEASSSQAVVVAGYQLETEDEREVSGALPIVLEAEPFTLPAMAEPLAPPGETISYRTVLRLRMAQGDKVFGKVATAVAVISVCGLLLTMAAHRVPPLPAAVEQTAVPTASNQSLESQRAPAAKAAVQRGVATPIRPEKPIASAPTRVVFYHPSQQDDFIARDTVVHYNRKPVAAPIPAPAPKKPGIKYYTDLK